MVKLFEEYAINLKNKKLFEMEEIYKTHFKEIAPYVQRHFKEICENIIKMQQTGDLEEISYLEYTLLYTNILQKKEIAEVRIYNGQWYFDDRQFIVGSFDFSGLFVKYNELCSMLMSYRKKFADEVSAQEVKSFHA